MSVRLQFFEDLVTAAAGEQELTCTLICGYEAHAFITATVKSATLWSLKPIYWLNKINLLFTVIWIPACNRFNQIIPSIAA